MVAVFNRVFERLSFGLQSVNIGHGLLKLFLGIDVLGLGLEQGLEDGALEGLVLHPVDLGEVLHAGLDEVALDQHILARN